VDGGLVTCFRTLTQIWSNFHILALRKGLMSVRMQEMGLNRRTARAKQEALGVISWRCAS